MTTTPTTNLAETPREQGNLCEADLEVGKPFVHPESRLEYADFHAYLCGKDPLPHWRNARIKEVYAGSFGNGYMCSTHEERKRNDRLWIDRIFTEYDRDGRHVFRCGDDLVVFNGVDLLHASA